MSLHNYKKASDYEVCKWLEESKELNLTPEQKGNMRNYEIVRFAPFEFYKEKKKINNVFVRLTLPMYSIVLLSLYIYLPINFIISGRWGYKRITWFLNWQNRLGI